MSLVPERREVKTRIRGLPTDGGEGLARYLEARDQTGRNRDVAAEVK